MRAISLNNKDIDLNEPFKGLLHKEWFVMKLTKMKIIIG